MSNDHRKGPGTHYSGANPIPNIQRFVQSLDADKKERDERNSQQNHATQNGDATDHKEGPGKSASGKGRKVVTDPTTGKEVEIEDVNKDFMRGVKDPQVSTYPLLRHNIKLMSIFSSYPYLMPILRRIQ